MRLDVLKEAGSEAEEVATTGEDSSGSETSDEAARGKPCVVLGCLSTADWGTRAGFYYCSDHVDIEAMHREDHDDEAASERIAELERELAEWRDAGPVAVRSIRLHADRIAELERRLEAMTQARDACRDLATELGDQLNAILDEYPELSCDEDARHDAYLRAHAALAALEEADE